MLSELYLNFIFGLLLTVIIVSLHTSCWFLPSPFNLDVLKYLFSHKKNSEEDSLKHFLVYLTLISISFIIQLTIPLGFVLLKKFLTSQISILDVIIICTAPAIWFFYTSLVNLWTDYAGRRVEFTVYPGSSDKGFENKYSSLSKKYKDFRIESIDNAEVGTQSYKINFTASPPGSLPIERLIREIFFIGGLLVTCLSGGLIGLVRWY
jgi:hypothetical protein